jgi:hypothetical protein
MKTYFWILFTICSALIIVNIYFIIFPGQIGTLEKVISNSVSIFTLIILLFTLQTYMDILSVSKETLSFTKRQNAYNMHLDNYKLFNDLAKRNINILYSSDGIYAQYKKYFENLTFDTIYSNYKHIIQNYNVLALERDQKREVAGRTPSHLIYKSVFTRFNNKVSAFIDALTNELTKVRDNDELSYHQKVTLIQLYANFILSDYLHLAVKLNEEITRHENSSILTSDLLQCNNFGSKQDNLEFDVEWFLILVEYLEISTIDTVSHTSR